MLVIRLCVYIGRRKMGGRGFGVEVLLCMCESRATFLSVPNKSLMNLETLRKILFSVIGRCSPGSATLWMQGKYTKSIIYHRPLRKYLSLYPFKISNIHRRPALQFSSILFEVHSVLQNFISQNVSKLLLCCVIIICYYYYYYYYIIYFCI
jgi:hypothetical protein